MLEIGGYLIQSNYVISINSMQNNGNYTGKVKCDILSLWCFLWYFNLVRFFQQCWTIFFGKTQTFSKHQRLPLKYFESYGAANSGCSRLVRQCFQYWTSSSLCWWFSKAWMSKHIFEVLDNIYPVSCLKIKYLFMRGTRFRL